jgi:hypothetical protein
MVQWGGGGLVLSGKESYVTAFFEAFPGDGVSGFIRGEGETVEAAEAAAFAKYGRERECHVGGGHRWTRARRVGGHQARLRNGMKVPRVSTYTNGGAFCIGCGAFKTVLPEVHDLGAWREPLGYAELQAIMTGMLRPHPRLERRQSGDERRRSELWRRKLGLRARVAGIAVPDHTRPEYAIAENANPFKEDGYIKACREAVVRYYVANRDSAPVTEDCEFAGLFDGMTRRMLESAAAEFLAGAA